MRSLFSIKSTLAMKTLEEILSEKDETFERSRQILSAKAYIENEIVSDHIIFHQSLTYSIKYRIFGVKLFFNL